MSHKPGDSQTAENIACSICDYFLSFEWKQKDDIPFCCKSCEDQEEQSGLDRARRWFCSCCIMSHVKRGHKIVDERGYEISVCSKHNCMIDLNCNTCSVVICFRCIDDHAEHNLVSIQEKSGKVRKEVFKYINEFDSLTKDVKKHQQLQKDCLSEMNTASDLCCPEKLGDVLSGIIVQRVKSTLLSSAFTPQYQLLVNKFVEDNNAYLNDEKGRDFDEVVNKADSVVGNLSNILRNSEGNLVKQFSEMQSDLEKLLKEQRTALDKHVCFQPFYIKEQSSFNQHLSSAISTFLNSMVWPVAKIISPGHFQLRLFDVCTAYLPPPEKSTVDLKRFLFAISLTGLDVIVATEDNTKLQLMITPRHQSHLRNYYQSLCSLCQNQHINIPNALFCSNCLANAQGRQIGSLWIFSIDDSILNTQILLGFEQINMQGVVSNTIGGTFLAKTIDGIYEIQLMNNRLLLNIELKKSFQSLDAIKIYMFYRRPQQEINCLIYDEERRIIKSHISDGTFRDISCPERPTILAVSALMDLSVATISSNSDILVIPNVDSGIPLIHHGLQAIDALHLVYDRQQPGTPQHSRYRVLLAWNFERKRCVVLQETNINSAT
ncbi:uncharacterized protein LOC142339730 [Convolutriloba macropyga]|uniref:uncharacterized protein LOC142339730 n=1 Tax=Convolutriloba macropyga TaxID=536237 RepID=UPI003F521E5F